MKVLTRYVDMSGIENKNTFESTFNPTKPIMSCGSGDSSTHLS